jgi:FMN phosphatase YigB (HAD superfamily)
MKSWSSIGALCIMSCIAQAQPIILWDLHDVIFEQKNPLCVIFNYPHLNKVITHTSWPLIKDITYELFSNIINQKSTDHYLDIARKHNNPYLEDLILQVANSMRFKPTMDDLVNELATQGYIQHIGSNIGPHAFAQLTNPQLYPEFAPFFALFDLSACQVAQDIDGIFIRKPDPRYFELYLAKNNLDPYTQPIIFIDENYKNIAAAQSLGFDTILFKHPYQLRTELRARGIDIAPPPYGISNQYQSYSLYNY